MKSIIVAGLIALGIGATQTATAQEHKYHPRYRGEFAIADSTQYKQIRPVRKNTGRMVEGRVHHAPRIMDRKRVMDRDPNAIAINKTAQLDRRVRLNHKQERQVMRMYKKEAKQMVKLQDIRKENRHELKAILTNEQYQNMRPHKRTTMVRKGQMMPQHKTFHRERKAMHMKAKVQ